ncbi:hypothetical protein J7J00_26725 [Bacillus sp. ISL-4]|uniref:hypothetical protein n=1 Tax=Bacillus sp. ISL-4 TaxID=2819125 RepID=UPI001BE5C77E|nr:hypothetical protein [Bacillus sp. ISL-4]MBT2668987.1 hypothetical protein [Bacillus sp. ISL-4]MBT2671329.1 hypothetical protein [Streptomyces sp. ISL-14]
MEKKHFFLDLEQASSLLDGCLMQPQKPTVAPSGRRNNLLSKYSTRNKSQNVTPRFFLTLPLHFFRQPFYPPFPLVSQTVSLSPYPFFLFHHIYPSQFNILAKSYRHGKGSSYIPRF